VLPALAQHLGAARRGLGMRGRGRGVVVGAEARRPAEAGPAAQGADGARRQAEGGGEGGGRLAAEVALPELVAHGDGDGAGHRSPSRGSIKRAVSRCIPADPAGTTYRRNSPAQPTVA
jgi:hypothetical protein